MKAKIISAPVDSWYQPLVGEEVTIRKTLKDQFKLDPSHSIEKKTGRKLGDGNVRKIDCMITEY